MRVAHSYLEIDFIRNKHDFICCFIVLSLLFCLSLAYEYYQFRTLKLPNRVNIEGRVLLQYKKSDYFILKVRDSNGALFYTRTLDDLIDLRGRFIRIYGMLAKNCNFTRYLKSCYVNSFSIALLHKKDYKNYVLDHIFSQHNYKYNNGTFDVNLLGSFYAGIFLATPMENIIRNFSSSLGISHLFAVSGFHLGILSLVLYFIFGFVYKLFHARYFSYRNKFLDFNVLLLLVSSIYLVFIDYSPSFLRSFVMFVCVFLSIYSGIRLVSFSLLLFCTLLIISIFPRTLFSIGFWLSVSGVFYIYLYIRHINVANKYLAFFLFNIVIFLNMLPISHYFFYTFSPYQILVPIFTMLFIIFYPMMLVAHIFGFGFILDEPLFWLIKYQYFNVELQTPFWLLIIFIAISFLSICSKKAYYFLITMCAAYLFYGFLIV